MKKKEKEEKKKREQEEKKRKEAEEKERLQKQKEAEAKRIAEERRKKQKTSAIRWPVLLVLAVPTVTVREMLLPAPEIKGVLLVTLIMEPMRASEVLAHLT